MKNKIILKKAVEIIICAGFLFSCGLTRVYANDNENNAKRLTWTKAVDVLLKNNPQNQSAKLSLDASRSQLDYSRASLFPRLSASGSHNVLDRSDIRSHSYSLSASQPLFSPALSSEARRADLGIKKSESDYNTVKNNLLFKLAQTFAQLSYAKESLKLSDEILKRRTKNVEIIRIKYRAGPESKAALLETESILKQALWTHENYRRDFVLAERNLNKLLGRRTYAKIDIGELPKSPVPPESFKDLAGRISYHPALKSKKFALDMARESVSKAKSSHLPTASADGNYSWSGINFSDNIPSWSAGASISWSFYTGGQNTASVDLAKTNQNGLIAELKNVKDTTYLNAEDKFLSWRLSDAYMEVIESSLKAVDARSWLVSGRYLTGKASYFEWTSVEEQLISAQKRVLEAKRNLIISYAAFLNSLGMRLYDKIN